MADHKRQHFVPRCYLRHFSSDGDGKAICLFHTKSGRIVQNASIKNQCAKPYFYGDDLTLERALQDVEGEYAEAFRNVSARSRAPRDEDIEILRHFMILQSARTEATILKTKVVWQKSQDMINAEHPGSIPELDSSTHHMMLMTLSLYSKIRRYLADLKVCLVRNKTRIPFITSDDPVAFTSMFHAKKLHTNRFGFGSTGALFFMPLSPKLLLLCYDGDAYFLKGKSYNSMSLSKDKDVRACNELQYLKAADTIYCSDWEQRCELDQEFKKILPLRKEFEPNFDRFVPDGTLLDGQQYRRLEKDEKGVTNEMMFTFSFPQIVPPSWVSPLRFRKNIRYFYNGSAAGYVRLNTRYIDLEN